MKPVRTLAIAASGALLCCCTSTESAIAPLGFGRLAKAELAERENTASRATSTHDTRPARSSRQARPSLPLASSAAYASVGGPPGTSEEPTRDATADGGALTTAVALTVTIGSQATDWVGVWKGKDTTRFQIPTFPAEPMTDDQARIRVESSGAQELQFVLIDSSNDQDLCSLSAKLVPPNQAQILAGQACFETEDESFELSAHVGNGTAKLQGAQLTPVLTPVLTIDITLDAEVTSEQARGRGSVEYHFEGRH